MKNKDEITAELKSLDAGMLAGCGAENVFIVPEHYFRQFPGQMMDMIQHLDSDTTLNMPVSKAGPFDVPQQYFDTLSDNILRQVRAMDQVVHQDIYAWEDPEKKNPFALPHAYFETFELQVRNRIFDQEEDAHEEIETLSPLLAGLKKKNTFAVPEHYFNSESFSQQAKQQEIKAKVIQHPSVKSIKWARWAAAAAIMAIFTMGGFHYLTDYSSSTNGKASFETSLAQIPDARIKEWLSINMDESDVNNLGSSIANINTIKTSHSLSDYSEKEIKDYLETEVW